MDIRGLIGDFRSNQENLCYKSMVTSPEEWPAFSTLLDEFGLLRDCFPTFSLSHIPRSDNLKADCLAQSTRTIFSDISFVNNFPPDWATNRGVTF